MDAHTEIINFAAAQIAVDLIADHPGTDEDHDYMIRTLAAYGPAITERD